MHDSVMTKKGYETLKEQLRKMKSVDRQDIIKEIAAAAAHGDLSENAEYDAAKEKQSFVEGRIKEIEQRLAGAQVVDPAMVSSDTIAFGATIILEDEDRGGQVTYQIVGIDEADVEHGKISVNSPIARALIGRRVDDFIEVKTPGGVRSYTVNDIRFE